MLTKENLFSHCKINVVKYVNIVIITSKYLYLVNFLNCNIRKRQACNF